MYVPVKTAEVVGHVLLMDIDTEGVTVPAMVDAGTQSMIISCDTLHVVVWHMRATFLW